jgi:hypothetical protein
MVRHCFTLDQQQKITKSKYMTDKGYAVLDESSSDDIINAAAEEGIFDTTLGLSERERRSAIAGKGYDASEIVFGEAKEGAVEAQHIHHYYTLEECDRQQVSCFTENTGKICIQRGHIQDNIRRIG